jgi:acyl carrier protein
MGVVFEQPKQHKGRRISLPGYSFTQKHFWKPQLQITYDDIERIKTSHHFNDNRFIKNRLKITMEFDLKKQENIPDEIFSSINQIQQEYTSKIESLLSKSDHSISKKIEMLYDTRVALDDDGNIIFSNEDSTTIRKSHQLYVAPETETEKIIAILWGEILGYEKVGILDNYFDVGGNSLLAIQLINRISNELDIELVVSEVLTNHTVKEIAFLIEEKKWLINDEESDNELII